MTRSTIEMITCPDCQHQSSYKVYESINATLEPKLKQKIVDWELFKFYCLNCGQPRFVEYETLYHDMEHQLMMYYLPRMTNRDEEQKRISDMFNLIKNVDGDDFSHSMDTYQFRIASDMESFVEKVQIFDAGYDDRIIELMKYVLAPKEDEDIQFSYDHMVFTKVGEGNYQFMFIHEKRAVASLLFSKEMYDELESEYGALLDENFFVDEEWAYRVVASI